MLRGSRIRLGSSARFSAQALMLGRVMVRRHLPTWTTRGTSAPTGTLSRTDSPLVSVSALVIGLPDTEESQRSQVGPVLMGSSGAFGTYTTTLYRGTLPAGS